MLRIELLLFSSLMYRFDLIEHHQTRVWFTSIKQGMLSASFVRMFLCAVTPRVTYCQ